jgi:hypothetical protein|tara:strand:+ start:1142 stop:2413 length:1272 start_codon:yes stop_codon:yes gene_type:complete
MQPHEIVDRLTILYGNKHPIVNSLERVVTTEELSSIFVLSSYLLGKQHRETVSALKNLIYERKSEDNIFVLFKVIDAIRDDTEALHALRNVCSSSKLNIPVLFRIITSIGDNKEAINALQNVCDSTNFVKMQTELLFKLIINLDNRDEDVLSAIKNLVSSDAEPDMFLLFKVLQAIDSDNESIGTLKSVTLYKTNILKLAHKLTEEKYTLPLNLKNMIKSFEGEVLTDSLSRGQLRSKIWVSDTVNDLDIDMGDMVYICAGWYGVLPAILFERNKVEAIRSFDIDASCSLPAETLNRNFVQDDWKFKASTMDVKDLIYTGEFMYDTLKYNGDEEMITDGAPTCVINTSCEHIEDFDKWWSGIPDGMLVIMQNNDFDDEEGHDHADDTVTSLEEFTKRLNVSETLYEGTLALDKYNRYMVIGIK